MEYIWARSLETGNAIVDNQHKQLFAELNKLFQAYRSGQEKQGMKKTLDFMLEYTLKHFADEEKLQEECGYPEYLEHKRLHDEFRSLIKALDVKLSQNGPTEDLILEVYTVLHEWLVSHIKTEDLKIVQHIQESSTNKRKRDLTPPRKGTGYEPSSNV